MIDEEMRTALNAFGTMTEREQFLVLTLLHISPTNLSVQECFVKCILEVIRSKG